MGLANALALTKYPTPSLLLAYFLLPAIPIPQLNQLNKLN